MNKTHCRSKFRGGWRRLRPPPGSATTDIIADFDKSINRIKTCSAVIKVMKVFMQCVIMEKDITYILLHYDVLIELHIQIISHSESLLDLNEASLNSVNALLFRCWRYLHSNVDILMFQCEAMSDIRIFTFKFR